MKLAIISERENLKTDSNIQMNVNTKQASDKLKEILQGKSTTEKQETSIGRLKRKLRDLFSTNSNSKKKLKPTSIAKKNNAQPEHPNRDSKSYTVNTVSVNTEKNRNEDRSTASYTACTASATTTAT